VGSFANGDDSLEVGAVEDSLLLPRLDIDPRRLGGPRDLLPLRDPRLTLVDPRRLTRALLSALSTAGGEGAASFGGDSIGGFISFSVFGTVSSDTSSIGG